MPTQPLTNWYPYFDKSGNFQECYGWENILREIFTVLVTRPGSRQWQPEFGCNLLDMLFEINLTEQDFVDVIKTAFIRWLPHVSLESCSCKISQMTNRYGLKASISMKIGYNGESKNVIFNVPPQLDLQNGMLYDVTVSRNEVE